VAKVTCPDIQTVLVKREHEGSPSNLKSMAYQETYVSD